MPTVDAEQSRTIARLYAELAATLNEYRFGHWTELTKQQRAELESHEWTLLTYSSNMTTHAIRLTVANVADAVTAITRATRKLAAAARRIAAAASSALDIADG